MLRLTFTLSFLALAVSAYSVEELAKELLDILDEPLTSKQEECGVVNPTGPAVHKADKSVTLNDGRCGIKYGNRKMVLSNLLNAVMGGSKALTGSKIIGGETSKVNEWPWIVSVQDVGTGRGTTLHKCGGSLIHKQWVVTSASCLFPDGLPSSFDTCSVQAVIAEASLQTMDDRGRNYKLPVVLTHPDFDSETLENDIALLKLEKAVDLSRYAWLDSICVEPDYHDQLYGLQCKVAGWGSKEMSGDVSRFLQDADVAVMKDDQCDVTTINEGQLCAGDIGKMTCKKDVGGPLFCKTSSGQWNQVGIVSGVKDCESGDVTPGYQVYTKLANYMDWVDEVIENN